MKTPYESIYYYEASGCGTHFHVVERHKATGESKYPHDLGMTAPALLYFLTQRRGVNLVVSQGAVGAANGNNFQAKELAPGKIIVPEDFMDITGEVTTLACGPKVKILSLAGAHVPAGTCTICPCLAEFLEGTDVFVKRGVLNCTKGPRLETSAEKALYHMGLVDFFGMHTVQRDWVLCQEMKGIHFLPLLHVTNMVFENPNDTGHDVERQARENFPAVMEAFLRVVRKAKEHGFSCECHKRPSIFDHLEINHD